MPFKLICFLFLSGYNVRSAHIHQKLGAGNEFLGLPRCKNLTRFSLFVGFCFAVRYCLKCFCFLCFTSSVSFTGSYTEVKPNFFGSCSWLRPGANVESKSRPNKLKIGSTKS